jgi:adenosylcobinamide-GDP ribazoletransferase
LRSALAAVALLTRVPVRGAKFEDSELAGSAAWIPIVGASIGLVVGGSYALLSGIITPLVAASLAVAIGILVTGALHEDGLADSADAFGGGSDRAETIRIMKDPTHGSYGVIALVLSVGIRVASLAAIEPMAALLTLPAIHALARAGSVSLASVLPPATAEGLGATLVRAGVGRAALIGSVGAGRLSAALLGVWAAPFVVLAGSVTFVVGRVAMRRIRGFTGDVLGAGEQLVEVGLFVLAAALAERQMLAPAPWWT